MVMHPMASYSNIQKKKHWTHKSKLVVLEYHQQIQDNNDDKIHAFEATGNSWLN